MRSDIGSHQCCDLVKLDTAGCSIAPSQKGGYLITRTASKVGSALIRWTDGSSAAPQNQLGVYCKRLSAAPLEGSAKMPKAMLQPERVNTTI